MPNTDDFIASLLAELPPGQIVSVEIDDEGTVRISAPCRDHPDIYWSKLHEQRCVARYGETPDCT